MFFNTSNHEQKIDKFREKYTGRPHWSQSCGKGKHIHHNDRSSSKEDSNFNNSGAIGNVHCWFQLESDNATGEASKGEVSPKPKGTKIELLVNQIT